ncbi:adenylate/guanylate cyclase domain-containing protein [Microvirga sesbaniae]|uniref:adenylate/guanylate cyclase domain-containing protein n=1 Tax=Microvirga sesbaniae TaxID=681392 RepID=UPI0021C7B9F0|nr:adenylate/guanylate cyclase domain-containing protein [Microvirga sp. HBU67692]
MAMPITARNKLVSILTATVVFTTLATLAVVAVGEHFHGGMTNGLIVGAGVGCLEEFYVQGKRGRWMRSIHPLKYLAIYALMVWAIYLVGVHLTMLIYGSGDELQAFYGRLPIALPVFLGFAVASILIIRVIHFIGMVDLLHLMLGTYHRPVLTRKVILFLDINGSTAIAEHLGALKARDLIAKFFFDISKPLTDHGGDVYLYKGDGLIATWDWDKAVRREAVLRAVDAMDVAIRSQHDAFQARFGLMPSYRIGIHGGEVVISEQGDTKRSIGIYGDPINIAARLEEVARIHGVACVASGDLADALECGTTTRMAYLGTESVRGISHPIRIFTYRPA